MKNMIIGVWSEVKFVKNKCILGDRGEWFYKQKWSLSQKMSGKDQKSLKRLNLRSNSQHVIMYTVFPP